MTELKCTRLVLEGGHGREAVLTAEGFVIAGPTGRIEAAFADDDGGPFVRLLSADGQARATIRASQDASGVVVEAPTASAALVTAGLDVTGAAQRIALNSAGLTVKHEDGREFSLPFALLETKARVANLARAALAYVKALARA